MFIEKLVAFKEPIDDIFFRLRYTMVDHGFSIEKEDLQARTFTASSRSEGARVDVKGLCFEDSSHTIVQIVYNPEFTPVLDRPISLKLEQQKSLISNLEQRLREVLTDVGRWKPLEHEALARKNKNLIHPENLPKASIRSITGVRLIIWTVIIFIGLILSYLSFIQKIHFGGYEGWATLIVFGALLLIIDLTRFIRGEM
jgi:hypothetical protein